MITCQLSIVANDLKYTLKKKHISLPTVKQHKGILSNYYVDLFKICKDFNKVLHSVSHFPLSSLFHFTADKFNILPQY